eukprot:10710145-Ditylum_brightwellii.AAC.1
MGGTATSTLSETRSTIDLRMGFLTMKYGIILHWDCSGMMEDDANWKPSVILIVLRKTCDKDFLEGAIDTTKLREIAASVGGDTTGENAT